MATVSGAKPAATPPAKASAREAKRAAALAKANRRRREIAELKADVRGGRLGPAGLLADPRAREVKVLTLLSMIPRFGLHLALEVLLACQINGARRCGELTATERRALGRAILQVGQGIAPPPRAMPSQPEGVDRELDRVLSGALLRAPSVELAPSEFAAARSGLEADPLLLRMVDRLVDAVRLYADRDDGGVRARVVAGQWIRFRNYRAKVASGECPPPTQRGPTVLE
ncbi:MAG TPA: hypothetical protein VF245_00815 [Solirubrobacterales bacterium]